MWYLNDVISINPWFQECQRGLESLCFACSSPLLHLWSLAPMPAFSHKLAFSLVTWIYWYWFDSFDPSSASNLYSHANHHASAITYRSHQPDMTPCAYSYCHSKESFDRTFLSYFRCDSFMPSLRRLRIHYHCTQPERQPLSLSMLSLWWCLVKTWCVKRHRMETVLSSFVMLSSVTG